jgi:hypothetical protein
MQLRFILILANSRFRRNINTGYKLDITLLDTGKRLAPDDLNREIAKAISRFLEYKNQMPNSLFRACLRA